MITLRDKTFKPYLTGAEIQSRISRLAEQINTDYQNRFPLFIAVLNGSFMFAADLMKNINIDCEITFVKLASYQGTQSSGKVRTLIGQDMPLENRHIVILEDIVDTGKTLFEFLPIIKSQNPASVEIASLLVKPDALQYEVSVKYRGLEIPNDFIVGYGLDYDGLGRNLNDIYVIND
jgi:hypoxanthine phosphoribosyltransferase